MKDDQSMRQIFKCYSYICKSFQGGALHLYIQRLSASVKYSLANFNGYGKQLHTVGIITISIFNTYTSTCKIRQRGLRFGRLVDSVECPRFATMADIPELEEARTRPKGKSSSRIFGQFCSSICLLTSTLGIHQRSSATAHPLSTWI